MEKLIKPIIEKAKKDKEVLAIALFGSYARNEPYRDIDICIFLNKKISNLEMSKKKIDYLTIAKKNQDIQIFQQLPLYIRMRVLKDAKILYCKNEDALYELAFSTIKEFNLYEKVYELCIGNVKNG